MMPPRRHQRIMRARFARRIPFPRQWNETPQATGLRNAGKRLSASSIIRGLRKADRRLATPFRTDAHARSATSACRHATLVRATGSKFHIRAAVSKCQHIGAGETAEPLHLRRRAPLHQPRDGASSAVPLRSSRASHKRQLPARVSDAAAAAA